jgi:hypothetical protein
VNQIPPAAYGILYFSLSFLANHKSIYQAIDLALDGLIRNRNFLGHGLLPFLWEESLQSASQTPGIALTALTEPPIPRME